MQIKSTACYVVEPRYKYKPLHNDILSIMNNFLYPVIQKCMKKNLDIGNNCLSFVKSGFLTVDHS